jgi:putative YphP/YqiW family bacilliredoxin
MAARTIRAVKRRRNQEMPYPEEVIRPMREELTRLGVQELRTPEAVDEALKNSTGTVMVVVNSICGCAAGKARPGIAMALQNEIRPDKVATVFAGGDIEATERARSYFTGYGPSSPSIGLLKDGQLVYMMERYQIEGRGPEQIAAELRQAFSQHCAASVAASN